MRDRNGESNAIAFLVSAPEAHAIMTPFQLIKEFLTNPASYPLSIIVGLIGVWLLSHIFPGFVKFSYDIKLERLRRDLLLRDKTAVVSDLVVLLGKQPFTGDDRVKANKHLLDLCLYLPPCLVHKLAHSLKQTGEADDVGGPLGIFVEIRRFIEGTYKPAKDRVLSKENIPQVVFVTAVPQAPMVQPSTGKRVQVTIDCRPVD